MRRLGEANPEKRILFDGCANAPTLGARVATMSTPVLEKIKRIVSPPASPDASATRLEGDGRSLALPGDFLELMAAFGPGMFGGHLLLCSAGNPHGAFDILDRTRENVEVSEEVLDYWKGEFRWPPYVWWPQQGSLVQWAVWDNRSFHWLTEGDADRWPVVVTHDNEQLHERLDMNATEVLHALLAGPAPASFVSVMFGMDTTFRSSSDLAG